IPDEAAVRDLGDIQLLPHHRLHRVAPQPDNRTSLDLRRRRVRRIRLHGSPLRLNARSYHRGSLGDDLLSSSEPGALDLVRPELPEHGSSGRERPGRPSAEAGAPTGCGRPFSYTAASVPGYCSTLKPQDGRSSDSHRPPRFAPAPSNEESTPARKSCDGGATLPFPEPP